MCVEQFRGLVGTFLNDDVFAQNKFIFSGCYHYIMLMSRDSQARYYGMFCNSIQGRQEVALVTETFLGSKNDIFKNH